MKYTTCGSFTELLVVNTRGVHVLRSPNLLFTWCVQVLRPPIYFKNYSPQEAENAVISQRNHPVDMHIFHNAHATIAWPGCFHTTFGLL